MKLFEDAGERSVVTTVLAGALIIADVINRGLPAGDETDAERNIRISNAFRLATQAVAHAEITESESQ